MSPLRIFQASGSSSKLVLRSHFSKFCQALFIRQQFPSVIPLIGHGAELVQAEYLLILSRAKLLENHRTSQLYTNEDGYDAIQPAENDHSRQRAENINSLFMYRQYIPSFPFFNGSTPSRSRSLFPAPQASSYYRWADIALWKKYPYPYPRSHPEYRHCFWRPATIPNNKRVVHKDRLRVHRLPDRTTLGIVFCQYLQKSL